MFEIIAPIDAIKKIRISPGYYSRKYCSYRTLTIRADKCLSALLTISVPSSIL